MKTLPTFILFFLFSHFSQAEDWPNWLGPQHNGHSREVLPQADSQKNSLRVVWEAEVGIGFSSVSVAKDRVYTMGHAKGQESVWCLDANDGHVIWSDHYDAV